VKGEPADSVATDAWLARPDLGVGLVSEDAAAAADFYAEVLGFATEGEVKHDARSIVQVMRAGANYVEIRQLPEPPPSATGGIYDAFGLRVLAVLVDDLDGAIFRIRSRGRRVADARDLPGRLRITFAKDPDGNMLELIGLPEPAGPELTSRLQIGLTVSNVEAARAFYGGVLGLPEQPPVPIQAGIQRYAFSAGRTTIKLWRPPDTKRSHAGPPEAAIGIRSIHLDVRDCEALRTELLGRGARLASTERDAPGFQVIDPDGNHLRFAPPG
jgi:glyoxylase I family protein